MAMISDELEVYSIKDQIFEFDDIFSGQSSLIC